MVPALFLDLLSSVSSLVAFGHASLCLLLAAPHSRVGLPKHLASNIFKYRSTDWPHNKATASTVLGQVSPTETTNVIGLAEQNSSGHFHHQRYGNRWRDTWL
ncbi:unnamed protein product [Polarella glacialis]|uniref:Secreted protein n=1 Tax=Polarella glacialis TaxID=89957 RepID=A0A813HUE8_POLGL|nr:unnamed protein product [Polarella glacialis]